MASKKPGSTRRLPSRCCQSLSLVHPKRCQLSIQGANDIGTAGSAKLRLPFAWKGARGNHEEVADHFPRSALCFFGCPDTLLLEELSLDELELSAFNSSAS